MLANEATLKSIWSFSGKESIEDIEGKDSTKSVTHFSPPWWQCDSKEWDSSETKRQLRPDLEGLNPVYESDDSQDTYCDSVEDFTAIPVQFRPKKSHGNARENPGESDSIDGRNCVDKNSNPSVKRESSYSNNKADKSKNSSQTKEKTHYGGAFSNSKYNPGSNMKSDAVILGNNEQTGNKSVSSNIPESDKRTQSKKKVYFDNRLQTKMYSTDSAIDMKKNSIRKGSSFYNEFAKVSFETLRLSDLKTNKPIWDNNLSLYKEKSQVWKFNGSSLKRDDGKPLPTVNDVDTKGTLKNRRIKNTGISNGRPKAVGAGRGRTVAWDDNMCLLKSNKNVNFQYISKEDKDGSSTITTCWGNVHQSTTRATERRSHSGDNPCSKNEGNKQNSESVRKNKITQKQTEKETRNRFHTSAKSREKYMNASRSKNPKTTIIRHEIKVIHVNGSNTPSISETKDSTSGVHKDQDDIFWKNLVSGGVGNRIFEFGMNANLEEKQLNPNPYTTQKHATGLGSSVRSDMGEKKVLSSAIPEVVSSKTDLNISKDDMEHRRSTLIQYGKEISDLIVGSYIGTMALLSFYDKWIPMRDKTICLLEQLADNISNLNRRNSKIRNVTGVLEGGGKIIAVAPDMRFVIAGKIIATISSIFSKLFQWSPSLEHSGVKESEMMRFLQEDIEATSDVYIYGIQCDQQFLEICKLIGEFQHFIDDGNLTAFIEGPEADFIKEMLHFSPKNYIVYYRKLYKCFEKLKERQTTDISRAFCRAFEVSPEAMSVINQLHWRFHAQVTDSEAAQRAWGEVCILLANSNSCAEIKQKIQDCIRILIKERNDMEKNLAELIKYKI